MQVDGWDILIAMEFWMLFVIGSIIVYTKLKRKSAHKPFAKPSVMHRHKKARAAV